MIHSSNFNSSSITRNLTSARALVLSELACSKTKKDSHTVIHANSIIARKFQANLLINTL